MKIGVLTGKIAINVISQKQSKLAMCVRASLQSAIKLTCSTILSSARDRLVFPWTRTSLTQS